MKVGDLVSHRDNPSLMGVVIKTTHLTHHPARHIHTVEWLNEEMIPYETRAQRTTTLGQFALKLLSEA